MYRRTDGWAEFPPCVLQDIVPYQIRCPKGEQNSLVFIVSLSQLRFFLSPGNFKDEIFNSKNVAKSIFRKIWDFNKSDNSESFELRLIFKKIFIERKILFF